MLSSLMESKSQSFDGACVVFATKTTVIKLPAEDARDAFMRELDVLNQVEVPTDANFVRARVEEVTATMLKQIPAHQRSRLWKGCVPGTPAILMDRLPGVTALEVVKRGTDPAARAVIVQQMANTLTVLRDHNLYHTDMKLENMQCIDDNLTIRMLDIGSIWWDRAGYATSTYAVKGYKHDPAVAMSVNIVCTLIELYFNIVPARDRFEYTHYVALRKTVLRQISCEETRAKVDALLVRESYFNCK